MRQEGRPETQGWLRRNTYLLLGASLWSVVIGASLGVNVMLDQRALVARCLVETRLAYQVLTLISPDLMARGGHQLGTSGGGPRAHVTSLDLVSPKNQPDDWEKRALRRLAAGAAETSEVTDMDGQSYFRLMCPLTIKQDCLRCHAGQGYKVGDMRGGISVDVPMATLWDTGRPNFRADVAGHGVIWLIGLGLVSLAALSLQRRTGERRKNEALFRELFDDAPVAYHEIDRDGVILRVNRAECVLLGFEAHELVGRPIWEFVAEAEREASRESIRRKLDGVDPLAPIQRGYVRRDGGELLLEIHESLVRDAAGEATGLRSALLNITERQQAEDALREAAKQWQTTFDAVQDAVCLLDTDQRVLRCNRAMAALTGGGVPADLIGRRCWMVVHGASEPVPECPFFRMRTSHRPEWQDLQLGDRWFDVMVYPLLDERQALQGAVQVIRDITERKRMEEGLRKLNRALRAISECNRAMVRARDETELLTKMCQIVVEVGGYRMAWVGSAEQDEARSVRPVAQAGYEEGYLETLRSTWADTERGRGPAGTAIRSGQPCTARSILTDPSFAPWREDALKRGYASAMALPLIAGGKTLGALSVYSDLPDALDPEETELLTGLADDLAYGVTALRTLAEHELAEAKLLQAQKMESVGRLAGGIAHDFNNMLTVINGYSQLLLGNLSPDDPLRANLDQIHAAGERAAKLTAQLLAFSRKQLLEPRVVDLNHLVGGMRSMLEPLVGQDVEVRVKLNPETGMVLADPHQLEQVIMNLVVNSKDAMPRGGKLLIETACAEFDESYAQSHPDARVGRYVMLAVSDNGAGMDEETRRRIFEPFFTTKGVGKGTGLGLSMVQGVVEQSGGHIEVYSEPGHGTTFKIYLPRMEAAVADNRMPETVPALEGKETVLVVENQAEVREYAVKVLQNYGYRVVEVENPGEAVSIYERGGGRVDLLLTDVVMPNISGREVADRLERLQPGIKVLFMSGYTDDMIVRHGVLDEGAHFIQKPFSPRQLAVKVREVLGPPKTLARILIADDEAGVRSFLRAALEQDGYEVIEAADGRQALKEARAGRVELVITDIVMPEQEGIETIQVLRKEAPGIGIIAISGVFDGLYLEVAQMLGADAVLAKPVSAQLLRTKVAEVLKSRR